MSVGFVLVIGQYFGQADDRVSISFIYFLAMNVAILCEINAHSILRMYVSLKFMIQVHKIIK